VSADPRDVRPPLVITLEPGAPEFTSGGRTVYLDPGKWKLKVEARGYLVGTHELVIKTGQPGFPKEIVLGTDPMYRQATFQIDPPAAVAAGASVTLKRMTLNAQPVCELDRRRRVRPQARAGRLGGDRLGPRVSSATPRRSPSAPSRPAASPSPSSRRSPSATGAAVAPPPTADTGPPPRPSRSCPRSSPATSASSCRPA
jgi:hypothetical protein